MRPYLTDISCCVIHKYIVRGRVPCCSVISGPVSFVVPLFLDQCLLLFRYFWTRVSCCFAISGPVSPVVPLLRCSAVPSRPSDPRCSAPCPPLTRSARLPLQVPAAAAAGWSAGLPSPPTQPPSPPPVRRRRPSPAGAAGAERVDSASSPLSEERVTPLSQESVSPLSQESVSPLSEERVSPLSQESVAELQALLDSLEPPAEPAQGRLSIPKKV